MIQKFSYKMYVILRIDVKLRTHKLDVFRFMIEKSYELRLETK